MNHKYTAYKHNAFRSSKLTALTNNFHVVILQEPVKQSLFSSVFGSFCQVLEKMPAKYADIVKYSFWASQIMTDLIVRLYTINYIEASICSDI